MKRSALGKGIFCLFILFAFTISPVAIELGYAQANCRDEKRARKQALKALNKAEKRGAKYGNREDKQESRYQNAVDRRTIRINALTFKRDTRDNTFANRLAQLNNNLDAFNTQAGIQGAIMAVECVFFGDPKACNRATRLFNRWLRRVTQTEARISTLQTRRANAYSQATSRIASTDAALAEKETRAFDRWQEAMNIYNAQLQVIAQKQIEYDQAEALYQQCLANNS